MRIPADIPHSAPALAGRVGNARTAISVARIIERRTDDRRCVPLISRLSAIPHTDMPFVRSIEPLQSGLEVDDYTVLEAETGLKTGLPLGYCGCVVGFAAAGFFGIQNAGSCARVSFGT